MDSKKTVYPYIPNSAPDVQAEICLLYTSDAADEL